MRLTTKAVFSREPILDGFGLGGYPVLMTTHEFYNQKANASQGADQERVGPLIQIPNWRIEFAVFVMLLAQNLFGRDLSVVARPQHLGAQPPARRVINMEFAA